MARDKQKTVKKQQKERVKKPEPDVQHAPKQSATTARATETAAPQFLPDDWEYMVA